MLRCRLLTEHARTPRSQSRTRGLFSASMGQEAIATGCVIDLRPQDTIALAPRDSIAGMVKGVALSDIVASFMRVPAAQQVGRPTSSALPLGCPPAPDEQLQAATSAAMANKEQNNNNVVVAFISGTCQPPHLPGLLARGA